MPYNSNINNLADWQDYLTAKRYTVFNTVEIPGDGFYAEVRAGLAQQKDFTNIGLRNALTQISKEEDAYHFEGSRLLPEKYEWVRLSFSDTSNMAIINS